MKKLLSVLCIGLLMMGCTKANKQSAGAAGSGDLQGKYEIDFSSMLSDLTGDSEEEQFAIAFASSLLSYMHMSMEFDGDKLLIDMSGPVRGLVNMFGDAKMPYAVNYKIENDSVLFIQEKDETEFKKLGVLRKPGASSNELHLVVDDDDDKDVILVMKKSE